MKYTKKILFATAFSMVAACSFAQHVELGLKDGLNISNLNRKNFDYSPKVGAHAGLLAHIHLTKTWAIQPELVYSMEGASYDGASNIEHKANADFINIPVLVQYMTGSGFRLQTGPQIGFLVSAKDVVKNGNTVNVKENFAPVNFSWAIGGGYLTDFGLGFDARLNLGLNDINDITGGRKIHGNVVQLGIFYQFMHRK